MRSAAARGTEAARVVLFPGASARRERAERKRRDALYERQRAAMAMLRSGATEGHVARKYGADMAQWARGALWEERGCDLGDERGAEAWLADDPGLYADPAEEQEEADGEW